MQHFGIFFKKSDYVCTLITIFTINKEKNPYRHFDQSYDFVMKILKNRYFLSAQEIRRKPFPFITSYLNILFISYSNAFTYLGM